MKIGFIGCGNMGSAMLQGILNANLVDSSDVTVSVHTKESAAALSGKYGVKAVCDNAVAAEGADVVILAVKPYMYAEVLPEIKGMVSEDTLVISVAAGQTLAAIEGMLCEEDYDARPAIVRAMPNTPALVGEAMSALCANAGVTDEQKREAMSIFTSFGKAEWISESLMDAVIGVSGSSPAYVYMFIEALADGAVAEGMPRAQAYKFAAQSVYGAAKMVLETGEHPAKLKDDVCSPGGTTIAAVAALEEQGFRSAVIAGEHAAAEKSRSMSK